MAHLELSALTKRYGDTTAVNGVSLSLEKRSLICLLGPSGCGKTTMLRLIAGFVQPTSGEIRVSGRVISSAGWAEPPERRNMSMVFQSYALWPHMTVAENVTYGLTLRHTPRADIKKRVATVLAMTRLEALAGRYPGELSGGQQQRVSLARALVVEPDILLLDEPLSNLDANLREEMRFEIRRLHDEFRYTTVYVTHDRTEAMTAADIIAVMNEGRVEQAGTPEQIYREPRTQFVARFIGGTNIFKGTLREGVVDCGGGLVVRCANTISDHSGETYVSVRFHDIEILNQEPAGTGNWAAGTVMRATYLGAQRDYNIALPSGIIVRVVARENIAFPEGEKVWLHFPLGYCRALAA